MHYNASIVFPNGTMRTDRADELDTEVLQRRLQETLTFTVIAQTKQMPQKVTSQAMPSSYQQLQLPQQHVIAVYLDASGCCLRQSQADFAELMEVVAACAALRPGALHGCLHLAPEEVSHKTTVATLAIFPLSLGVHMWVTQAPKLLEGGLVLNHIGLLLHNRLDFCSGPCMA